jgi:hypothetical protein
MLNSVLKDSLQLPRDNQGFYFNFPAAEDKDWHKMFAYSIGQIEGVGEEELAGLPFCVSTLIDLFAQYGSPEVKEVFSFITQVRGYIGGDLCVTTPPEADEDTGAVSIPLMLEMQLFKDEVFGTVVERVAHRSLLTLPSCADIWPLIELVSNLHPAIKSIWTAVKVFLTQPVKDTVNNVLALVLPGRQVLAFNVGKTFIAGTHVVYNVRVSCACAHNLVHSLGLFVR